MEKKKIIITKVPRGFIVHVEDHPEIPPKFSPTYLNALGLLLKWHDEELGLSIEWNDDPLTKNYLDIC